MRLIRPLTLVAGATVPAAGAAHASGLDAPGIGSMLSGPLTADPAAVYHNPASLAFLERPTLLVGAGLVVGRVSVERERRGTYQSAETLDFKAPVAAEDRDPGKTGVAAAATATPFAPAGDVFFAMGVGDSGVTLGLGACAPYAAIVDYPDDGAQRFAVQDAFVAVTHITGAAGVQVNRHLGLGGSVAYVLGNATMSRIQDFGALTDVGDALAGPPTEQPNDFGPDAPIEVRELDTLARSVRLDDGFAQTLTFAVGAHVRPTERLQLAATYQHGEALAFAGRFRLDLNDDLFTGDLAHVGLQYKPVVEGDAHVRFQMPRRIGLAGGYAFSDRLWLEGRAQYVTWSELDAMRVRLDSPDLAQPELGLPPTSRVTLPRHWQDTVTAQALARWALAETVQLVGLVGYDSPVSPDATIDAASPDGHRFTLGGGAAWAVTDDTRLVGDLRLQAMVPREVSSSDHDLGNGRYTLFLAGLGVHMEMQF